MRQSSPVFPLLCEADADLSSHSMAYIGQNFNPLDLDVYLRRFRPDAVGYEIPVQTSDGAVNDPAMPVR